MKKNKSILFIGIMIFLLFILCACLLYTKIYCKEESKKLQHYTYSYGNLDQSQGGYSITFTNTKNWYDDQFHADYPNGAEFDGVLKNESGTELKDWSIKIYYSENVMIDSSWNGDYEQDNRIIKYHASGNTFSVQTGQSATFGMVLYSKNPVQLLNFDLSGYKNVRIIDLPVLYILIALLMIWIIVMTVYILLFIRVKRYRRRHELDSKIIKQTMNTLVSFIDAKDNYTKGHSTRVAEYSKEIAKRMKLSPDEVMQVYYIALMHDCGKIAVPDAVLKKNSKLTDEEYKIIQSHTTMGDKLLDEFTAIPGIRDGAHYHHERYDGNGYPMHLKAENIPLCARIICVADSFDAMSSNRCYRKKFEMDKILKELNDNSGTQFDPQIIPYMLEMIQNGMVEQIQQKYPISS